MINDDSTLIKDYSSSIVKGGYEKIKSLQKLKHKLSKGELIELFINDLLSNFLTEQFSIGSGVIVDHYGNQSKQTDIIIYDNRILPPFIKSANLGVYPLECVLAVIEVKSVLSKKILLETQDKFKFLDTELRFHENIKPGLLKNVNIVKGIIGFNTNSIKELMKDDSTWLENNIFNIDAICQVQKYSWIRWIPKDRPWHFKLKDEKTFEETKRFIAWMVDATRQNSYRRNAIFEDKYISWITDYIRNQG